MVKNTDNLITEPKTVDPEGIKSCCNSERDQKKAIKADVLKAQINKIHVMNIA